MEKKKMAIKINRDSLDLLRVTYTDYDLDVVNLATACRLNELFLRLAENPQPIRFSTSDLQFMSRMMHKIADALAFEIELRQKDSEPKND